MISQPSIPALDILRPTEQESKTCLSIIWKCYVNTAIGDMYHTILHKENNGVMVIKRNISEKK